MAIDKIRHLIQDYLAWEVSVNTPESVIEALEIEVCYNISFWGALIVHAAESSVAAVLYSEDLPPGHHDGSVEVVNPHWAD